MSNPYKTTIDKLEKDRQEREQLITQLGDNIGLIHDDAKKIGTELDKHIELVHNLNDHATTTRGRVARMKNRVTEIKDKISSYGWHNIVIIGTLTIIALVLLFVLIYV